MTTLLLIHGGLWDDMDAERFWHKPGIVAGLHRHGITVLSPNRAHRAPDWASEVEHLTAAMPNHPVTVIAGSNGCSAAVRLTLVKPEHVERLLLAWAPTAGDPDIDARTRRSLTELGAPPHVIDTLLTGQTLRGVTDDELAPSPNPSAYFPQSPRTPSTSDEPSTPCSTPYPTPSNCPAAPNHPIPTSRPTPSRSSTPRPGSP